MLENATRICEAKFGMLYRFDGQAFHFAAEVGAPLEYAEFNRRRGAFQPLPGGQLERVMLTKKVSHTADAAAEAVPGMAAKLGWRTNPSHRPDAQGRQSDRRNHHLPAGSPTVYHKTDRAC